MSAGSVREDIRLLGTDVQVRGAVLKSLFAAIRNAIDEGELGDADNLCTIGLDLADACGDVGGQIETRSRSINEERAA